MCRMHDKHTQSDSQNKEMNRKRKEDKATVRGQSNVHRYRNRERRKRRGSDISDRMKYGLDKNRSTPTEGRMEAGTKLIREGRSGQEER